MAELMDAVGGGRGGRGGRGRKKGGKKALKQDIEVTFGQGTCRCMNRQCFSVPTMCRVPKLQVDVDDTTECTCKYCTMFACRCIQHIKLFYVYVLCIEKLHGQDAQHVTNMVYAEHSFPLLHTLVCTHTKLLWLLAHFLNVQKLLA